MEIFDKYDYPTEVKLKGFEKYVKRYTLARFLARYELFKIIKNVKGSIVECGVHFGSGLMSWAKLSASLEPYALHRKVYGFDTFEGFPEIVKEDMRSKDHDQLKEGGFKSHSDIFQELQDCIEEFDKNRYLNNHYKVKLVKGDASKTIPKFVEENPHLIVALLFIDFDIYQPTKTALREMLPRIPKGGILAFDEVNNEYWAGETIAMLEELNLNNYALKKFDFDPNIAYIVL